MTDDAKRPLTLDEANAEIDRLRAELAGRDAARAPIAIVGMGCRYPCDVRNTDEFWQLLKSGRDILRDIPKERWDVDAHYDPHVTVPGKMYVRQGYYLNDIDQFDPQFFGLSPREAESLDPQQRLVMEVSWETLEHAGIAPDTLKGGKTGVFVGQYWDDYSSERIFANDNREIDRYAQLSALRGLTAGRICHVLDSHGPAIQLDTACSSSALAVHLACQSLRSGESDLALAGGVSLVLSPEHLIGICQMTALSPDGRCKTFDAGADGFGQGEGCGMIALKRLRDAQADGDTVLAVVQGTAVNHDGQARTVTTPSGPAQRAMLQDALDDAGLEPHQVGFVETHGTGTPLGDPIEVSAIARVLCQDRMDPLYLGAVKTNIGHLDSAAGIAGLMKVVLALQHETIPANLNYSEPNRHIPWNEWPIKVPQTNVPWQGDGRFAGLSAFGMSGTNVHLILGQAPTPRCVSVPTPNGPPEQVFALSTQSDGALPVLAARYAAFLEDGTTDLRELCKSAATGRSQFAHRAAFCTSSTPNLAAALDVFAKGGTSATAAGTAGRRSPKLAFLFTGQGAQHIGMGKALYTAQPSFAATLDHCAVLLRPHLDRPLTEIMWSDPALNQTANTQPALFAIEYALAKLYQEWGIQPDAMLGHSIGEYVAACIAGVFSLEDALRLVTARGRLMQSLPEGGKMVSVAADEPTVQDAIDAKPQVTIAAVNGPRSIVISGAGADVDAVVAQLTAREIKTTALTVSHAFHSPMMDPILEDFRKVAATVDYKTPSIALLSNVTGQPWTDAQVCADYWVDHLRGSVRFADGIDYLQSKKVQTFVELGPKPTLTGLGRACVPADFGAWLPSLRPNAEWTTMLDTVAQLFAFGVQMDWAAFYKHTPGSRVSLPTYPWRHQRCWTDVVRSSHDGQRFHPLVHTRIENASRSAIFETRLSADDPAYLSDHRVFGSIVFPASAFFEMAMVVARDVFHQDDVALTNVTIGRALVLSQTPVTVQVVATARGDVYDFEISSRQADNSWIQHATGTLERRMASPAATLDIAAEEAKFPQGVDVDLLGSRFEARGLEYLSRFQAIKAIYRTESNSDPENGTALARLDLPPDAIQPGDTYRLHPVLTDASFRIAEAIFPDEEPDKIYLPFGVGGFRCDRAASGTIWVKATAQQRGQTRSVDLELFSASGDRVASIDQLTLRAAPIADLKRALAQPQTMDEALDTWLYQIEWVAADEVSSAPTSGQGTWLVLPDAAGVATALVPRLQALGQEIHVAPSLAEAKVFLASQSAENLTGILHLWALDTQATAPRAALMDSLAVIQSNAHHGQTAQHWFVTKGAQSVRAGDRPCPWQGQYWGFGRTLQVEHPDQLGGCIDLDPTLHNTDQDFDLLTAVLCSDSATDSEIAFRHHRKHAARLEQFRKTKEAPKPPLELDPKASYVITGGVGALGLQVAQYLANRGAKHLVLTGRSGVSTDDQREVLQALEDAGVTVQVVPADISQSEDVSRVLAAAPRLRGIVHAAGVLDDGMLVHQNPDRFAKVAGPKISGAWHLHLQTADVPLDFFVLFSSVASVLGSPGQANYATANAFMDGLAHLRRAQGLPALAINWGPWADVGMASADVVLQRLMKDGWQPMKPEQGCDFIGHLLTEQTVSQAAVLPVDWGQFVSNIPGAAGWSMLRHLAPATVQSGLTSSAPELAAQRVKEATPQVRVDLISSYLLERIAQTLRVPVSDLDEDAQLGDLGVDSLTAVEIRLWIQRDLEVELAVEQLFTVPNIRDLAIAIDGHLGGGDAAATIPVSSAPGRWFVRSRPRPAAHLRLFCFPFAGGGASAYQPWADSLPASIELCAVQMPGREDRLAEPLIQDMSDLVDALAAEIAAFADRSYAFFGHSMGAIIAYETAKRVRDRGEPLPVHLFLSARAAPQLQPPGDALRNFDDDALVDRLHQTYGAVPDAIRHSTELRNLFLPILRADVALLETYADTSSADPLGCPITALGGTSDPAVTFAMLSGWQTRTNAAFDLHSFPGDHFYITTARAAVISTIVQSLEGSTDGT